MTTSRVILVLLAAGLAACDPGSPHDDFSTTVAFVEGDPIALEDVRVAESLSSDAERRAAVDRVIDLYLASEEAHRRGLGFTEGTVGRIARIRREARLRERQVLREALYAVVEDQVEIAEAEVRDYYEQRKDLYAPRVVALRTAAVRDDSQLQRLTEVLDAGGMLGPENSRRIGPVSIRALPKGLRVIAREMKRVGEHAVIAIGESRSIIQLVSDERGEAPALEKVREGIEKSLRDKRAREDFAELLRRLREEADVEIIDSVITHDSYWAVGDDTR